MTGADLLDFTEMIRRMFARQRFRSKTGTDPLDSLDDVQHEAAVEIWQTRVRTGLPLTGNRRYYYQAGARAAGLAARRARSAVTIAEKQQKLADKFKARVPVAGCGSDPDDPSVADIAADALPDERLRAREVRAATDQLLRIVADHVRQCSDGDRRALEMLLGIGTEQADDGAQVAWRTGMTPVAVANAIKRLSNRVRADPAAVYARRVILDLRA